MGKTVVKSEPTLYEQDFYAWLMDQANKLRAHSHNEVDWDNLAEEVESVGRSQKREIRSRLQKLIHHLLKWQFQPGRRSESWRITIGEQRTFIPGIVEDSPSLRSFPASIFAKTYLDGRRDAIIETGFQSSVIPIEPPFTLDQALDYRFLPGEPLKNSDVFLD